MVSQPFGVGLGIAFITDFMQISCKPGLKALSRGRLLVAWANAALLFACAAGEDLPPTLTPSTSGTVTPAEEDRHYQVDHWSFWALPDAQTPEPSPTWGRNGVDAHVAADLATQGLTPSPEAEPAKLLRRLTLTLTGLPPTEAELDAFEADPSDAAYLAAVERLLDSPRYSEHMTVAWLELARYADTDGYQYDHTRYMWPWRDWVLQAFRQNMPFDEFTIQQLAGDLLPSPTQSTLLATSFGRNHPIQGENGLLKDEFRDRYVSDRVNTVGKTWLGLTMACAKCHDHKFDPISADDYFRLYDCFNHLPEGDNGPSSDFAPTAAAPSPLHAELSAEIAARSEQLQAEGAPAAQIDELVVEQFALDNLPEARIMSDQAERRTTLRLALGRYDLPTGNPIQCSAPSFLPPFPEGAPANRLGLAQWLTMPEHPLTARVTVNRYWRHHFGSGLVSSVDDFGLLTAAPDKQPLLDWLAKTFVESGWDLKALHRLIVTSSTFRQSSLASETLAANDPHNEWLARGPRFRLPAEVIRDLPLAASGLLVHRLGGAPVFPYQPAGLWKEMAWEHNAMIYPYLSGDGLYRRSLYTFWRRSMPPPFLSLFDAADRDESAAYREPSESPQQALALLNGTQFLEAARHLAADVLARSGSDVSAAIGIAFRRVTSRRPSEVELATMMELFQGQYELMDQNPGAATLLLSSGRSEPAAYDPTLAALTQVARVLFNLSETLTQE